MAAKCALYRHFDAEDKLLYVGISLRPFTRIKEHSVVSNWADAIANVRIEYFPTRKEALEAEAKAVQEENPLYNIRLRKPKKEPKRAAVVEEKAEEQRITLTQRVIRFDPLYKVNEAANALGISTTILKREIEEGNLSVTMIRSPVVGRMNPYITGWQLIDWLESQELKSMGANND
jgi:excinuclease UvrABC nuclease subunit